MRFLIDRCAGHALSDWLKTQLHDVLHIAEWGPDPGDDVILQKAFADARILITIDADFGTLVFRDKSPHAGIIRLPNVPSVERIEIMRQLLEKQTPEMEAGAMITVRGKKIRITNTG